MCMSDTFEINSYYKFLSFIIDLNYNEYFKYSTELIKIFNTNIDTNKNLYIIKGIVCNPSSILYNC